MALTWQFSNVRTSTNSGSSSTEIKEEPAFSGAPWFIPEIDESSVVSSFKFREVEGGNALIVVTTHRGEEYSYEISTDDAQCFYADLEDGASPGQVWNEVRHYFKNNPLPTPPVETSTVSISGPADKIALIAASAEAQGLTIF